MIARKELKRSRVPRGVETKYTRQRAVMSADGLIVERMEGVQVQCNRLYFCESTAGTRYWKPQAPPTTPGHSFVKFRRAGGKLSRGCGPWTVPEPEAELVA